MNFMKIRQAVLNLITCFKVCGRNLITRLTSAASPRVDISCLSPSVDLLPFGVIIPATVPQRSEIQEGLMNYPI
jgi:hypothetical protein